jgi:O-acetyl-ADP-ribose deacetylase (regulator of RNase III)
MPIEIRFHENILLATDLDAICVTTNGIVKANGELVMGAGVALAFAKTYPALPKKLGELVKNRGNRVISVPMDGALFRCGNPGIISFPTKHDYASKSDPELIRKSALELMELLDSFDRPIRVGLPAPGARNGGLTLTQSIDIIDNIIDERVIIYH